MFFLLGDGALLGRLAVFERGVGVGWDVGLFDYGAAFGHFGRGRGGGGLGGGGVGFVGGLGLLSGGWRACVGQAHERVGGGQRW